MQINHLPAVKTRCCSAMPFCFLFFLLFVLNFTALKNIGNPLKVSKLQPGVVLIGTNFFRYEVCQRTVHVCACAYACACVHKTNIDSQTHCVCMRVSVRCV